MAMFLEKSTGSEGFHQVIDFLSQSHISYALTKKPEIYISFIKQFWRTAEASTDTNGEICRRNSLRHIPAYSPKKSLSRKRTRSTTKRQKVELDDEKEDLKGYLDIVPREEISVDVDSSSEEMEAQRTTRF
ncbi:hypothetical protein Tco_1271590 [Tanacetum coccineum]